MPYNTDAEVPTHVPAEHRKQWRDIWNSEYKKQTREGKSHKDAEQVAFKAANGVIKRLSEVPSNTERIPGDVAGYMELPGAEKDGQCSIVDVDGGISMFKGCCNLYKPVETAQDFRCGDCIYHLHEHELKGSEMPKDCGEGKKAVGDQCVPRSKFLIQGSPDQKDTWKEPIHDEVHVRAALSRFNQTKGATKSDAARLASAARKYNIDLKEFKKHLSEGGMSEEDINMVTGPTRLFASALHTLGDVVDQQNGIYKIPIAYTGTFYKDGDKFDITEKDLDDIIRNFSERELQEVNLDYDHASEMPEIAKGGAIPSAGGIVKVFKEPGPDKTPWLFGHVHYTDPAAGLVNTKQYRYFSPAIDWSAKNKHTGQPQGATLTSAALTNRPFLEKLGPLPTLMSEAARIFTKETLMPNKVLRIQKVLDDKGQPKFNVRLMGDGTGDASFGEVLGEIYPADMAHLGEESSGSSSSGSSSDSSSSSSTTTPGSVHMNASPPSKSSSTTTPTSTMMASEVEKQITNILGEAPKTMSDVRKFYMAGKSAASTSEAQKGQLLLSETFTDKGWNEERGLQLLADGKVSSQQYAAFTLAAKKVQRGIDEGKIHPSQAQFFLHDAINRPQEFAKFLDETLPYIDLTEHGLAGTNSEGRNVQASERDRIDNQVKQYMKDNKCTYSKALKALTKDPKVAQAMRDNPGKARLM